MRRTLLILAAVVGSPSPAFGQPPTASSAGSKVINDLAACVVQHDRSAVIAALASARDYKSDTRVMRKLQGRPCLPRDVSVSIDPEMYRGALARALVRADYSNGPAQLYAHAVREKDTWASIMGFADCVVRADPENSYKLIMAEPESDVEEIAFNSLAGQIDRCKPWAKVSWPKYSLIMMFSEAYYRASRTSTADLL